MAQNFDQFLNLPPPMMVLVMRMMTAKELVQLFIVSDETALLVADFARNFPRYIEVAHTDDTFEFRFQAERDNPPVCNIRFRKGDAPPAVADQNRWFVRGFRLPVDISDDNSIIIYCNGDHLIPARRLFDLLFVSTHLQWRQARFIRSNWLTRNNLIRLLNCERIILSGSGFNEEDLSAFLGRWIQGRVLERAYIERDITRENGPFDFHKIVRVHRRQLFVPPQYLQRGPRILPIEYARLVCNRGRSAAFYRRKNNNRTDSVTLQVGRIEEEEGEIPMNQMR